MGVTDKKSLAELFRPSKRIREAIPAGTQYKPAITTLQFYKEVEEEIKKRIEEAKKTMEENKTHKVTLDDGNLVISMGEFKTVDEIIDEIRKILNYMQAFQIVKAGEKALKEIEALKKYEENAAYKTGIDELRKMIIANDWMTAAALTEDE